MARVNVAIQITSNYRGAPGFNKADKDVKKFRKSVGRAANSVRAFQFVLAGVTISTLTIWGKKLVDAASKLQLLQIRLANVEGGAEAGQRQFKRLFEEFRNAPFEIDKVVDGFVRLRAAGIGTEDANNLMKSLVDAVAVFGGTSAELQRATIGFQQVAGKGVLSMEELRQQIGEAVPSAMAIMSREAGVNIAEFVGLVKRGMISSTEAIRLFTEGAQEQFGGFAAQLAPTIEGSIAGSKNKIIEAFSGFLDETDFSARIAAVVQVIGERVATFVEGLDQTTVDQFWKSFVGVANVVEGIVKALAGLVITIGQLLGLVGSAIGPAAGTGITYGIIGAMIFGAGPGKIIAAIVAIGEAMGIFKDLIPEKSDLDLAFSITKDPRVQEAARATQGEPLGSRFDTMKELLENGQAILSDGTFVALKLQATDAAKGTDQYSDAIERIKQELKDFRFAQLKAGLQGLGIGAAKLAEDIITLGQRAEIAAGGGFASWTKQIDRLNNRIPKLEARIKPLAEQLKKDFAKSLEDINSADVTPERRTALLKEWNTQLNLSNEALATMEGELDNARAAVKRLTDSELAKFSTKLTEQLTKVEEKTAAALGEGSPLERGLRNINAEYEKEISLNDQRITGLSELISKYPALQVFLDRAIALKNKLNDAHKAEGDTLARNINLQKNLANAQAKAAEFSLGLEIKASQTRMKNGLDLLLLDKEGLRIQQMKDEMTQRINSLQIEQINAKIELDKLDLHNDQVKIANLHEMIRLRGLLIGQIVKERSETTATGELEKQVWTNVGNIIENGVGNAIEGVITGQKSLREAGLEMWRSLIAEAARYIVKLLIMKALGAISGGGSPTAFMDLWPNADGNAFKGNIKPFADGGLIRGPTMFGLAGESGTEAIMPLKRHGGKLGVSADGMGGDTFNINIQAMDTQTGAEFLMKNMQTIVQGLGHENSLNRSGRRGV